MIILSFPGITLPSTQTNSVKSCDLAKFPYTIKIDLVNVKTKVEQVIPKSLTFECVNSLIIKSQRHSSFSVSNMVNALICNNFSFKWHFAITFYHFTASRHGKSRTCLGICATDI